MKQWRGRTGCIDVEVFTGRRSNHVLLTDKETVAASGTQEKENDLIIAVDAALEEFAGKKKILPSVGVSLGGWGTSPAEVFNIFRDSGHFAEGRVAGGNMIERDPMRERKRKGELGEKREGR